MFVLLGKQSLSENNIHICFPFNTLIPGQLQLLFMKRKKFQRCEDPVPESRCHSRRESHSSSREEEAAYTQAVLDPCGISRTKLPEDEISHECRWGSGPPVRSFDFNRVERVRCLSCPCACCHKMLFALNLCEDICFMAQFSYLPVFLSSRIILSPYQGILAPF